MVLIAALLAVIGVAGYHVGMNVWASRKYHAASDALQRYDYGHAGKLLQSYLSRHPTDAPALLLAAQTARRRSDFDEADKLLRLAQKYGTLDEAIAMERRLLAAQAGDLSDAAGLVQFCKDRPSGPETALILECLIEGSLRSFHLPLAKWCIEAWLKDRPGAYDQAQGLLWRGRLNEYAEDFPLALADFKQAAALAPNHLQVQLRLAQTMLRNDPRQAIPYLDRLNQHHADNADVRIMTARLQRALGRPEDAVPLLDAILVATPDQVDALIERGRVALDMNRPLDAEPLLRRALVLKPEQRDVNQALADCLRQAGKQEEALPYQNRVREIEAALQRRIDEMARKTPNGDKR